MNRLAGVSHQRSWAESSGVTCRSLEGGSDIGSKRERYHACKECIFNLVCCMTDVVEVMRPKRH